MGAFLGEEKKFYRTYHPESYEILRKWLITVTKDPDLGSQGLMQRAKEFSSALEEFLQDRIELAADHRVLGAGHPEVGDVSRALGQDGLIRRLYVGVGPGDGAGPPVQVATIFSDVASA